MPVILKAENLNYSFSNSLLENKEGPVITGINLELKENSIYALIGESGGGKTTLAKILAGIEKPTSGKISVTEGKNIQLLFQNSEELLHPSRKVSDILKDVSPLMTDIENICGLLNLDVSLLDREGGTLSGGERQRAALARILLRKPDLIIMDEPFSAQDPDSQNNFTSLFKEINKNLNISFFIISHNLAPIGNLADYIFVMLNGKIIEEGAADKILKTPSHPYTGFLLKAGKYDLSREMILQERNAVIRP